MGEGNYGAQQLKNDEKSTCNGAFFVFPWQCDMPVILS